MEPILTVQSDNVTIRPKCRYHDRVLELIGSSRMELEFWADLDGYALDTSEFGCPGLKEDDPNWDEEYDKCSASWYWEFDIPRSEVLKAVVEAAKTEIGDTSWIDDLEDGLK